MALPTIPKFTVSRIQHRRGNMIDLPQPLAFGEFGFVDDENRLFIGGSQDSIPPMVKILPSQLVLAQSVLDNITLFSVPVGYDTDTALAAAVTEPVIPIMSSSSFFKSGTYMYVSFTDAQIASGRAGVEAKIALTGATLIESGLSATITNNVILVGSHDEANGIAYSMNYVANAPVANTNLNVEIYTEVTSPTVLDFLGNTYILPPAATNTIIPSLPTYLATSIGAIDTVYSAFGYNSGSYYTANGIMKTTACATEVSFSDDLVDNVTGTMSGGLFLSSELSGSNIVFKYRNTTSVSLIFKIQNTAWSIT